MTIYSMNLTSVRVLAGNPAIRTTAMIAFGGISFMLANVIYAKLLVPDDFGRLILLQTVTAVSIGLSPLGFDVLIARKDISNPRAIIGKLMGICLIVGLVFGATVAAVFDVDMTLIALIVATTVGGAATRLYSAIEQSEQRFTRSMSIFQSPQVLFLVFALGYLMFRSPSWEEAGMVLAACYFFGAALGFWLTHGQSSKLRDTEQDDLKMHFSRALAIVGAAGTLLILNQMEKLIAGETLGMAELGTLGLASTLVASPFKLLSAGVGYTLLPRLKSTADPAERRKLLVQEFQLIALVGLGGALVLLAAVPTVVGWLFRGEYEVTFALVAALVLLGLIRLNSGVLHATVNALSDTRTLHLYTITGWLAAGVAAISAILLSSHGTVGIVAGVAIGWTAKLAMAAIVIRHEL